MEVGPRVACGRRRRRLRASRRSPDPPADRDGVSGPLGPLVDAPLRDGARGVDALAVEGDDVSRSGVRPLPAERESDPVLVPVSAQPATTPRRCLSDVRRSPGSRSTGLRPARRRSATTPPGRTSSRTWSTYRSGATTVNGVHRLGFTAAGLDRGAQSRRPPASLAARRGRPRDDRDRARSGEHLDYRNRHYSTPPPP
jgi:hypothetical protein